LISYSKERVVVSVSAIVSHVSVLKIFNENSTSVMSASASPLGASSVTRDFSITTKKALKINIIQNLKIKFICRISEWYLTLFHYIN